jgi:Core histone H2A/H2B/H3/H4
LVLKKHRVGQFKPKLDVKSLEQLLIIKASTISTWNDCSPQTSSLSTIHRTFDAHRSIPTFDPRNLTEFQIQHFFTAFSLACLQEAAESYLVGLFEDNSTLNNKSITIMPRDILVAGSSHPKKILMAPLVYKQLRIHTYFKIF